eukprot:g2358.t1
MDLLSSQAAGTGGGESTSDDEETLGGCPTHERRESLEEMQLAEAGQWREVHAPNSQHRYYVNESTQRTAWRVPCDKAPQAAVEAVLGRIDRCHIAWQEARERLRTAQSALIEMSEVEKALLLRARQELGHPAALSTRQGAAADATLRDEASAIAKIRREQQARLPSLEQALQRTATEVDGALEAARAAAALPPANLTERKHKEQEIMLDRADQVDTQQQVDALLGADFADIEAIRRHLAYPLSPVGSSAANTTSTIDDTENHLTEV